MIKPVTKLEKVSLRESAKEITEITDSTKEIIQNLNDTLIFYNAAGLAANQIGYSEKIFIGRINNLPKIFINPVITKVSEETQNGMEGCFSVPGVFQALVRPLWIEISYRDEEFNQQFERYEGLEARMILHEVDHLNGKLFIDKLSQTKKDLAKVQIAKSKRNGKWNLDDTVIKALAAKIQHSQEKSNDDEESIALTAT